MESLLVIGALVVALTSSVQADETDAVTPPSPPAIDVPLSCPSDTQQSEHLSANGTRTQWCEDDQGRRQGEARVLASGGAVISILRWKDGERNGPIFRFDEQGRLEEAGGYLDGKQHGVWWAWRDDGQLESQLQWCHGKLCGTRRSWHASGELATESTYDNGKRQGVARTYDADGQLTSECEYRDDQREGLCRDFEDTQLVRESEMSSDRRHGLTRIWSSRDGALVYERNYVHGEQDGDELEYDAEGQIVMHCIWQRGHVVRCPIDPLD